MFCKKSCNGACNRCPRRAKPPGFSIEQITVESPLFADVLELRAEAYGRQEAGQLETVDPYSLHFIARSGVKVLALRNSDR